MNLKSREGAALAFLTQITSSSFNLSSQQQVLREQSQLEPSIVQNTVKDQRDIEQTNSKEISIRDQAAIDFLRHIELEGAISQNPNPPSEGVSSTPALVVSPSWKSEDDSGFLGIQAEGSFIGGPRASASVYNKSSLPLRSSLTKFSNKSARSSEVSFLDPLIVFTIPGGPVSLFSMIPLRQNGKRRQIKKDTKAQNPYEKYLEKIGLATINFDPVKLRKKFTAESFASLLEPEGLLVPSAAVHDSFSYDPYYLDHPDLKTGKNKTVITLPSFLGTIIQPSTASELKKELNRHFKEAHPDIDSTITLSQIRAIKRTLCKIGVARDLDASSIAFAFVYLEKLILKNVLIKSNRKLISSVCLLLAVKVNDSKDASYTLLLDVIEKELETPRKDIFAAEFQVYTELDFSLFLPMREVGPHIERVESLMKEPI